MDIAGISAGSAIAVPSPQASALEGLADAQNKLDVATEKLSTSAPTPELVLDISSAQTQFAASAEVLKSSQENTKKLLDVLA